MRTRFKLGQLRLQNLNEIKFVSSFWTVSFTHFDALRTRNQYSGWFSHFNLWFQTIPLMTAEHKVNYLKHFNISGSKFTALNLIKYGFMLTVWRKQKEMEDKIPFAQRHFRNKSFPFTDCQGLWAGQSIVAAQFVTASHDHSFGTLINTSLSLKARKQGDLIAGRILRQDVEHPRSHTHLRTVNIHTFPSLTYSCTVWLWKHAVTLLILLSWNINSLTGFHSCVTMVKYISNLNPVHVSFFGTTEVDKAGIWICLSNTAFCANVHECFV